MSARITRCINSLALLLFLSGCASSGAVEVPVEIRSTSILDVSPSQRVWVVGFVVGGTTEIDINEETVRLLRSQLRSKTPLTVIDNSDVLPVTEMAVAQMPADAMKPEATRRVKSAVDLHAYEWVFAEAAYWKRLGEEYQSSIIVTGTMFFTSEHDTAWDRRDRGESRNEMDSYGNHLIVPGDPILAEHTSCALRSTFIFIDGRSGTPLYSAVFHEAVAYDAVVPALSGYFDLMNRVLPSFLSTVSTQAFRSSRRLLP